MQLCNGFSVPCIRSTQSILIQVNSRTFFFDYICRGKLGCNWWTGHITGCTHYLCIVFFKKNSFFVSELGRRCKRSLGLGKTDPPRLPRPSSRPGVSRWLPPRKFFCRRAPRPSVHPASHFLRLLPATPTLWVLSRLPLKSPPNKDPHVGSWQPLSMSQPDSQTLSGLIQFQTQNDGVRNIIISGGLFLKWWFMAKASPDLHFEFLPKNWIITSERNYICTYISLKICSFPMTFF